MRKLRKGIIYGLAAAAFCAQSPAYADIECHGQVLKSLVQPDGTYWVDWGFGIIAVCNVNNDMTMGGSNQFYGYKTCQTIMTTVLTAQASGKELWVRFPSDTNCTLNAGGWIYRNTAGFRI